MENEEQGEERKREREGRREGGDREMTATGQKTRLSAGGRTEGTSGS